MNRTTLLLLPTLFLLTQFLTMSAFEREHQERLKGRGNPRPITPARIRELELESRELLLKRDPKIVTGPVWSPTLLSYVTTTYLV